MDTELLENYRGWLAAGGQYVTDLSNNNDLLTALLDEAQGALLVVMDGTFPEEMRNTKAQVVLAMLDCALYLMKQGAVPTPLDELLVKQA